MRPNNRWLSENGFTCYQVALAYILCQFAPHLLIPVRERLRADKTLDGLYYVAFLNVINARLISFRSKYGLTYRDLAREDGWELKEESPITREQLNRLGELLDEKIVSGGFILVNKEFHGETLCLSPYDPRRVELKSKSGGRDLWKIGRFLPWLKKEAMEMGFSHTYHLVIADMLDYYRGSFPFLQARFAGRCELDALLAKMPLAAIMQEVEASMYPWLMREYYGARS